MQAVLCGHPRDPKKLSDECEKQMVEYCDLCWELGIPKTRDMFSGEVVHYMQYDGIPNTFPNVRPGEDVTLVV